MGEGESWRAALEEMGFAVECPMVCREGIELFKGLAWYPELIDFFLERLQRGLFFAASY